VAGMLLLAASANNADRVGVNVPTFGYMNLIKTAPFAFPAGTVLNDDGYPTSAVDANANFSLKSNYFDQYVIKWTGAAAMQFTGQCAIIYEGGSAVTSITSGGGPAGTGYADGNFRISTSTSSPRVVFKFGTLVTSVSGGGGSLVTINHISVNFGAGFATGRTVKFAVGCSSNLLVGPNSDGSWTVTNVSATSFTLDGSTGVSSPTVTGSGGVGTQTEVIRSVVNQNLTFQNSGTYSSPADMVLCTVADETDIDSGLIYDPVFVAQLQELKGTPAGVGRGGDFWLRFMDPVGGNISWEMDYSQLLTPASLTWSNSNATVAAYQAGAITNGGASGGFTDLYTCASNPTNSPASGPPEDGEIIQGTTGTTNSGGSPGLTVSGRSGFGNWPIINASIEPIIFKASSAPASSGLTLQFTFTATWLNGGTPYVFSYLTVSGDTTLSTFYTNLRTALIADLTLRAGNIVFSSNGSTGVPFAMPPTPLAGVLTVSYTSGPAIMEVCTLLPSSITASSSRTFVFNNLLGAFIYTPTFTRTLPMAAVVELCNRVGACCWYTWPIYTKASMITGITEYLASLSTGLTPGLKFGGEVGNEVWNFSLPNWGRAQAYGIALGCFAFPYGSNGGPYSWQGLRTIQYGELSVAAWNAVRAAGDHRIFCMTQSADTTLGGNWDLSCLQGRYLVTSNTVFAAYGGLGGTSVASSYNTAGTRPVDVVADIGMAPYWASKWMGGGAPNPLISGTVAENAPLLQASLDFVQGNTATALAAMSNMVNGTTTRSSGSAGQGDLGVDYAARFALQETLAAQYDSYRRSVAKRILGINHYEAGFQGGMCANLNNGLNSADCLAASIPSADITALANAMAALSWDVSAYTVSGTNDRTEMATQLLQVQQGWKYDTDVTGVAANTNAYKNLIKAYYYGALRTAHPSRETHGSQYGYQANSWGLWWTAYNAEGEPYQSYDAIAEYNA
jgi:hypothetical protein